MGSHADTSLGPEFTKNVISSMGPNTTPRMREVMGSLIQHLHDFARDVNLTADEWMAGVQMINWAGQMSTDRRNEGQLMCDVIGLESYVSPSMFFGRFADNVASSTTSHSPPPPKAARALLRRLS